MLTEKVFGDYFDDYHRDFDREFVRITTDNSNEIYSSVVFNFAYILGQNGIENFLEDFASVIIDYLEMYDCKYYLIYQNSYCHENYKKIKNILKEKGLIFNTIEACKDGCYPCNVIRNLDIAAIDSFSSRGLNYEISQLTKGG